MNKKNITGSTLKLIAIAAMLIDHIGAVILERMLVNNEAIFIPYAIMRCIGRIAFPIFCFLLVEGFMHTSSKKKYALRLLAFALISEVPFNLAVSGSFFNVEYQNVFFTLLIGLLVLCAFEMIKEKLGGAQQITLYGAYVTATIAGAAAAWFLNTDYSLFGVLAIAIMYVYKEQKAKGMLFGCLILTVQSVLEAFAFIDVLLVRSYNGERGIRLKYIFYIFYPVHLLVLYLIAYYMGIVA